MKRKDLRLRTMLLSGIMSIGLSTYGQHAVTENNQPRSGDELYKQQTEYVDAGEKGQGQWWDFSSLEVSEEGHQVLFMEDSILTCIEDRVMSRYRCTGDSLVLTDYQTPLVTMSYQRPVLQMVYPFCYGQTDTASFDGRGTYCDRDIIKNSGEVIIEADATGTVFLTPKDTVRHVLRLHCIKTNAIHMFSDSASQSLDNGRQQIEERYLWYAPGYRYPVFETLLRTNYLAMNPITTYRTSFRYLPADQRLLPDSVNERIAREQQELDRQGQQRVMGDYEVGVVGQTVHVTYSFNSRAHVTVLVADVMGMLYERRGATYEAGSDYSLDVDCSRLRHGQYILYINVNGEVYSEKFKI